MRRWTLSALAALMGIFLLWTLGVAQSPQPRDMRKRTELGKYVNAQQAYEMWKADPEKVIILDCRTPEEYALVGHAPMAYNIPSRLWTGKWNAAGREYEMQDNPDFESLVKDRFDVKDILLVMCRSGHRSAASVNRLSRAGFVNAYNIVDGFEGDLVEDRESYFFGKRMLNGWKNSGAPWTYQLDPELVYVP